MNDALSTSEVSKDTGLTNVKMWDWISKTNFNSNITCYIQSITILALIETIEYFLLMDRSAMVIFNVL